GGPARRAAGAPTPRRRAGAAAARATCRASARRLARRDDLRRRLARRAARRGHLRGRAGGGARPWRRIRRAAPGTARGDGGSRRRSITGWTERTKASRVQTALEKHGVGLPASETRFRI